MINKIDKLYFEDNNLFFDKFIRDSDIYQRVINTNFPESYSRKPTLQFINFAKCTNSCRICEECYSSGNLDRKLLISAINNNLQYFEEILDIIYESIGNKKIYSPHKLICIKPAI